MKARYRIGHQRLETLLLNSGRLNDVVGALSQP
jgi:hypothetical protein